jgi:transposase
LPINENESVASVLAVNMGRRTKELSLVCKDRIVSLFKQGLIYRKIGTHLNLSFATVQCVNKKFKTTNSIENNKLSGQPRVFSTRDSQNLVQQASRNPKTSARKLAEDLATPTGKQVSLQTIRNHLHESGYKGRAARKKPFINERNRRKRLEFASAYVNKPIDFWKTLLFFDESKFNIFGSDGPQYVWRKPKKELDPKKC